MKDQSMTSGPAWKHIISFSIPVLLGSLLQQLYNTVDTIVVGNFSGEASLSAVGTTASFVFLILALATGFSSGNGILISQNYGAKDLKQVREDASTGIILLLILGILTTLVSFLIARPVFEKFIIVPPEILDLTLNYFYIYAFGLIFQFGYNIFAAVLRAIGDSAASLYFLLIASVLNIFLDIYFVAYFNLGVIGVAIATDISQAVSFVFAYCYMIIKYPIFRFGLKEWVFRKASMISTFVIGFPIVLQMIILSVGLSFIQRAVNSFGTTIIASFTVGQRIEMYLNLPCTAFQTTLATFTGQNVGARKLNRVVNGTYQTILISMIVTTFISILVYFGSATITGFFGLSGQAASYCNDHLRAIALINFVLGLYVPLFGVFQGTGHSIIPTIVATAALSVRVIITFLLKDSSLFGYTIIWWNGIFGFTVGFIISWSYFLSKRWERNARITSN